MSRSNLPIIKRLSAGIRSTSASFRATSEVLPDGSPAVAFLRLDRGDAPTDHHTLAFAINFQAGDQSRARSNSSTPTPSGWATVAGQTGWKPAWGIGRHIFGSQIFDYWNDPWGDRHEHYCDGDLFTGKQPTGVYRGEPDAMAQWGPVDAEKLHQPKFGMKSLAALAQSRALTTTCP